MKEFLKNYWLLIAAVALSIFAFIISVKHQSAQDTRIELVVTYLVSLIEECESKHQTDCTLISVPTENN